MGDGFIVGVWKELRVVMIIYSERATISFSSLIYAHFAKGMMKTAENMRQMSCVIHKYNCHTKNNTIAMSHD